MCGPDTSNKPRGGAIAVLRPPAVQSRQSSPELLVTTPSTFRAEMIFHSPSDPDCAHATHVRLMPEYEVSGGAEFVVVIHQSGNLSLPTSRCGLFRQFDLPSWDSALSPFAPTMDIPLAEPVVLGVGGEGVIGRRVSVFSRTRLGDDEVMAEGIIGFNS